MPKSFDTAGTSVDDAIALVKAEQGDLSDLNEFIKGNGHIH